MPQSRQPTTQDKGAANQTKSAWGDAHTQYFYQLTPDRILDAVESSTGLRCTGRAMALNSMENRVYELEIELDHTPASPSERFLIAKFYRPGRWSEAQIRDEHTFLADLADLEIPVVAPRQFVDGDTLHKLKDADIYYAVFAKVGGRSPDELSDDQLTQVGRLLARIHNVGATKLAPHRIVLSPTTYGINNLQQLLDDKIIPQELSSAYAETVRSICAIATPWFATTAIHRIHGDCHLGNLLQGREQLFFVDFDDMVMGPAVQDIWLLIPGRDSYAKRQLSILLDGYCSMRDFDHQSLRLIEALRALRFVHFSAWIGRRWQDPAFPRAFPQFGTPSYWQGQLRDLREQLDLLANTSTYSW
ncbi:MAG: serine/threonine protein kinase [Deltaproteobacteria bacterium]|nr:serine/threonine protein kinase [Deltaproteobacteria bacterium]